ncbi:MAG: hypothetical protein U1E26_03800 [Coriobacteriia bacterium]|nr:hypothetical protein [Coriobacteriia bacterium]
MVSREDIMTARDDLFARREALLARANEIREEFGDRVDGDAVTMAAGLTLVSGGVAWGMTQVIRGHKGLTSLLAPLALVALGLVIVSRSAVHQRGSRILAAEGRMRDELAALDPLARIQVLKDMAGEQMTFVRHAQN